MITSERSTIFQAIEVLQQHNEHYLAQLLTRVLHNDETLAQGRAQGIGGLVAPATAPASAVAQEWNAKAEEDLGLLKQKAQNCASGDLAKAAAEAQRLMRTQVMY